MANIRLLAVCAFLLVGFADAAQNISFRTTWFGAKDNCPPGGDIAYPTIHKKAGGIGTYVDPITFAGVKSREAPGTIYYVNHLSKYFVMEDECQECGNNWKNHVYHIDLWMGPDTATPGPGLIECENQLTISAQVWVDPPHDLPVDTTLMFDANRTANDGCILPVQSCTDKGDTCGNDCQIPSQATCHHLATLFALSYDRFTQLNKNLDCTKDVPKGHTVCMGGTCGD